MHTEPNDIHVRTYSRPNNTTFVLLRTTSGNLRGTGSPRAGRRIDQWIESNGKLAELYFRFCGLNPRDSSFFSHFIVSKKSNDMRTPRRNEFFFFLYSPFIFPLDSHCCLKKLYSIFSRDKFGQNLNETNYLTANQLKIYSRYSLIKVCKKKALHQIDGLD